MKIYKSNFIKGADIRRNPAVLNNIPMVGLCKCWADKKTLELILNKVGYTFENVEKDLDRNANLYCVFVGGTKRMYERIVDDHLNGKSKSTLRISINSLFEFDNDKQFINDFVNKLYFECVSEEHYKKEKNRLLGVGGKFYVLNINENRHKLAIKIKPILSKFRKL